MTRSDPQSAARVQVHPELEDLVRLQFDSRQLSLLPKQPVDSLLSGRHGSRLRGRGLTFEELRRYRPGDDIRAIDWKATARLRKTHVRVFSEERDRPVMLVVDQRQAMFFGSRRATKATVAAEAAALAAWSAIHRGDRVGAIVFNESEYVEVRPQRSRGAVMRICNELIRFNKQLSEPREPLPTTAGLNVALRRAVNVAHHDHLVILLTDYLDANDQTQRLATQLVAHNDVIAALVYDPLGIDLPASQAMEATDGQRRAKVPEDRSFAARYQDVFQEHCRQIVDRLQSIRIPILPLCTHDPVTDQLMAAFGRRK